MENKKVIDILQEMRSGELTAIAQYFAHHYEAQALGFKEYGKAFKEDSIEEMKHAEILAERILYLGGELVLRPKCAPKKGGDIKKKFQDDLDLEMEAVKRLNGAISAMMDEGDHSSRIILENILVAEERHIARLQKEINHITNFGDQYLAIQATA